MATLLRALGLRSKPPANALRAKLPALHDAVEVSVSAAAAVSVTVESLGAHGFAVSAVPGVAPGTVAMFAYGNARGKFRFAARCTAIKGHRAEFSLPVRIETVQASGRTEKRSSVRLEATVPAQWRYAAGGKGSGEYVRGSLTDISRTGASLIADRHVVKGTNIEVRFLLNSGSAPLELLGEVMRCAKVERSGKSSLGLRFVGASQADDRAIMEFINKRQAERRRRGLA